MDYRERVQLWSEKLAADDPLRVELVGLSGNDAELQERFVNVPTVFIPENKSVRDRKSTR